MPEDDNEKTEEPSQRRLDEAVKKGQIPFSREVSNLLVFFVLAMNVAYLAAPMMHGTTIHFTRFIESPHTILLDAGSSQRLGVEILLETAKLLFVPILFTVIAAFASSFLQNGIVISSEPLVPKLSKISPASGLKRLFSMKSLLEFIKGILKMIVIGYVCYQVVKGEYPRLEQLISYSPADILKITTSLAFRILVAATSIMFVIAILDIMYQRFHHIKELRMSRQEMKEEYKQQEGDPQIKQRLRQIRMERAKRRMMSAVPEADVVIRNPTHFAVALKYDDGKMAAPVLTAKGADNVALRIIALAEEHKVPVIENPPLARALFESTELDQEIPLQHYQAVAEVIGFIYRMRGKQKTGRA